jgi:hypothetical protein
VTRPFTHPAINILAMAAMAASVAACTTDRVVEPAETADEQLLVSSAVDRAVDNLVLPIVPGTKVFVDDKYFDADANIVLPKYTVGAIRDLLGRSGGELVDDRKSADVVAELRNGAQGIDHDSFFIGLPAIPIPIPLSGTVTTPEIPLFKRDRHRGISKIAVTFYSAQLGTPVASSHPVFGNSHSTGWTAVLFISWSDQDIAPDSTAAVYGQR